MSATHTAPGTGAVKEESVPATTATETLSPVAPGWVDAEQPFIPPIVLRD